MAATSIDEVLISLQGVIDTSLQENNRGGYFAALYYRVTARVKEGLVNNEFDDGVLMEQLDVVFANRFIEAWEGWRQQQLVSGPWATAFGACRKSSLIVVQHLLLGINAHINFDLGIAALEAAGEAGLPAIRKDYNQINAILASMTYDMISGVNRVSPLFSLIGWHATNFESILTQFSIENARDGAWCFAEALSLATGTAYGQVVNNREASITRLAEQLCKPAPVIRVTLFIINVFEWKSPRRITRAMYAYGKKYISFATPLQRALPGAH